MSLAINQPLRPSDQDRLNLLSCLITAPPSAKPKSNITQHLPKLRLFSTTATISHLELPAVVIIDVPPLPSSMVEILISSTNDQYLNNIICLIFHTLYTSNTSHYPQIMKNSIISRNSTPLLFPIRISPLTRPSWVSGVTVSL